MRDQALASAALRPWYTVHALAVAARRANVAGVVRLSCGPDWLEIELMRVTSFASGFAPAGVAEPVTFRVPYTAVRGLLREGRLLYLALDPASIKPYSRFALARFSDEPGEVLARVDEVRRRLGGASAALPLPIGLFAALLVPASLAGGVLGRASVGAVAALSAWALLRAALLLRTFGGPFSDRLRDRFEAELSERLALLPPRDDAAPARAVRVKSRAPAAWSPGPAVSDLMIDRPIESAPAPAPAPLPRAPEVASAVAPRLRPRPEAPAPWWRRPWFAALSATIGAVMVIGFLRRFAAERPPPPAITRASAGLAAAARSVRLDVRAPRGPDRCLCTRAASPLWADGVPVLSVLTFEGDEAATAPPEATLDRANFPQYRFDLAIVNNGARALRDVRLTLTFARRNRAGKRVGAVDRGLFWEGVLGPGRAAKWHVSAPGNELSTDISVTGTLDRAHLDPAPADAFFALTGARVRAVRVHAAVMLAYLRDPRAESVARALAAQSVADEVTLGRVRRAAAPVFLCDVVREAGSLDACVFNGSTHGKSGLALREVPTSPGAAARSFPIEPTVPVHQGVRLHFEVPADLADEIGVVDPSAVD